MNTICKNVQKHLLDPRSEPFGPRESDHLRDCPACRQVQSDLQQVEPLLSALALDVTPMAIPSFEPLKQRIRQRASRRLRAFESGTGWLDRFIPSAAMGRRLVWACATLALVATIVATLVWRQDAHPGPIGRIDFVQGPSLVYQGQAAEQVANVSTLFLHRASRIETDAETSAMIQLDAAEGMRIAVASSTSLGLTAPDRIALDRGAIWLSVKPRDRGFKVQTPYGEVEVVGTHFGVAVENEEMTVEVTQGKVRVSQGTAAALEAGYCMSADAGGLNAEQARADGVDLPGWVTALRRAEDQSAAGAYLPSVTFKTLPSQGGN